MPSTDIRYPADPAKQNHYERWLAERAVQKDDSCGCEWCLEWDAELRVDTGIIEARIGREGQEHPVLVSNISPSLSEAVTTFRTRGRPAQSVTPDQQAILDRTDLSIRQKAEKTGISSVRADGQGRPCDDWMAGR